MANFEAVRTYLVDTLYPQLQPVFTALQNFFIALQPIVEASLNAIMNVFNIAFPYIQQVMTDLVPIFEDAINRITQEILPLIIPIINQIVDLFRILAPFIGPILTLLVEMIKNGVNTTITVVRGLLIFFRGFLDLMIGLFTNNHERVRRGFLGMFSGIAVAVGGIFKGIANSIINQVNALIRTVNVVLSKLPTGGNLRIPTLATFAKGTTYASGGTALVGENGPELVQLPTGAKVRTASTTASMSAGSGQTINIDARGALIDERGLLDLFRKYGIKLQTT
jgi:phage-related protein